MRPADTDFSIQLANFERGNADPLTPGDFQNHRATKHLAGVQSKCTLPLSFLAFIEKSD